MALLNSFVLWFIPPRTRAKGTEELRRAKLVVYFSFALSFWAPVFSSMYYFLLGSVEGMITIALAGFLATLIPLILRYTGWIAPLGNYLTLLLFSILSYTAYISGGHGSPPLMWLVAVPMIAICMAGIRSGFFWAFLCISEIIAYYLFDRNGFRPPYLLPQGQFKLLEVSVLLGLLLLILSLTLIYEALKKQAMKTIEDNAREIAVAKDLAEAASKAKTVFLANMSHELRTPMHGILSYAHFGHREAHTATKEVLYGHFRHILESSHRLLALLNNLLDLSKLESGKMTYNWKQCDLQVSVQLILAEFKALATDRKLNLEFLPAQTPLVAFCDREKVEQVLRNIVSNSLKFATESSTIQIGVAAATITLDGPGPMAPTRDIPGLSFFVINQGVGIPENELDLVFDKFYQSSKTRSGAGGTGLGLAICKEIITAHRGRIFAESASSGETKFTFILPVGEVS